MTNKEKPPGPPATSSTMPPHTVSQPTRIWNLAIIGCGRMGRHHAGRLLDDPRGRLIACSDQNHSQAIDLAGTYAPQAKVVDDWTDLLTLPEVDGVIICTPTTSHHEQVSSALANDKHVLCEKPLAAAREHIEQLMAQALHSSATTMLAYQRRFWSPHRTLRREVLSGRHGPIRAVTSHNTERWQQTIAGTWRDDPQINIGGFAGDAGSHKMDMLFFITGLQVEEVFARSSRSGSRVNVLTSISGVLSGDVPLTMDLIGNAQSLGEDFAVHCAEADLLIRDRRAWIARHNQLEPLLPVEPESHPVSGFLDTLLGIDEHLAPFDAALPVFDFLCAVEESAASGRPVRVRP